MSLDRILQIVAALLGMFGSVLLAKGTLRISARVIARVSQTVSGHNSLELRSIASQKADFMSGIPLIIFAFLVQLSNLVFIAHSATLYPYLDAVGLIVFVATPPIYIAFLVSRVLAKKYAIDSFKYIAIEEWKNIMQKGKVSQEAYEDCLRKAAGRFGMRRKEEESPAGFMERYSDFLGLKIPSDTDMNELMTNGDSRR